jgi:hypothetical protein
MLFNFNDFHEFYQVTPWTFEKQHLGFYFDKLK